MRGQVHAAGLVGLTTGEVGENQDDDFRGLDASDVAHSAAALRAVLDVDAVDALDASHAAQRLGPTSRLSE